MRALIAGGGIGGLAAVVALQRVGVEAVVLEKAPEFAEVGAGQPLRVCRAQSERWIFPFRGNAGKVRYQRLAVFAQSVEYNVVAVIHEVGERGREPYNSLPVARTVTL